MGTPRFTPEFKEEAVRQITERGYSICKRTAITVLTNGGYLVGSTMRHGSSSLTRFTGQSAMTSRIW